MRWLLLNRRNVRQLVSKSMEHFTTNIAVIALASAEQHAHTDLIALLEEFARLLRFEADVMVVGFRPEPQFFYLDLLALFARLLRLLFLLVPELAVVHHAAHRRTGIGGYFDEIQTNISSVRLGLLNRYDPFVRPLFVDQTHFWNANTLIDAIVFANGSLGPFRNMRLSA